MRWNSVVNMTEDASFYVQGVLAGARRIFSKAITLIESSNPEHQRLARSVISGLLPHTGGSIRLGISGVPGAGKSSFIERLGTLLLDKGYHVAVLAVDPSSKRSGGSIMADKTRMEKLAADRRAFIRPSPSGGILGGVARKTRETLLLCEAAGYDVIMVETVGVGQSEIDVASMVDFFLILMLAGAGDEIQGIKKGVLELADALVIHKADGDNVENAKRAQKTYENALRLLRPATPTWRPPVMTCSSLEATGIEAIWQTILTHRQLLDETGERLSRRRAQAIDWMEALIEEGLKSRFYAHPMVKSMFPELRRAVQSGTLNATAAAEKLLFFLDKEALTESSR